MIRFALVLIIFLAARTPIAWSVDGLNPEPPKTAPVYVKIIWPVDAATVSEQDRTGIESWIAKKVKNRPSAIFMAVTGWVQLGEERYEATDIWDGKLDGKVCACPVSADIAERKEGRIKIVLRGWDAGGKEITVTLDDEPGSRKVVAVTEAETKQGVPYVAVLVGARAK